MKYVEDAYAQCPFYMKETRTRLVCEGIPTDSNNTTLFKSSIVMARHKERYCRSSYGDCPLCKALMDKYA